MAPNLPPSPHTRALIVLLWRCSTCKHSRQVGVVFLAELHDLAGHLEYMALSKM